MANFRQGTPHSAVRQSSLRAIQNCFQSFWDVKIDEIRLETYVQYYLLIYYHHTSHALISISSSLCCTLCTITQYYHHKVHALQIPSIIYIWRAPLLHCDCCWKYSMVCSSQRGTRQHIVVDRAPHTHFSSISRSSPPQIFSVTSNRGSGEASSVSSLPVCFQHFVGSCSSSGTASQSLMRKRNRGIKYVVVYFLCVFIEWSQKRIRMKVS